MALIKRYQKTTEITYWEGEIPLNYIYTVGRAGERFFREIMENGRIIGARCDNCKKTYVPPRIYCEDCFARLESNYVEVSTQGTVHTYMVCYRAMDGSPHEKPSIIAMVRLDGADGGLIHFLGEVEPEEVQIGMRVEAVFKEKDKREGSIFDIKYFRPIK